MSEIFYTEHVRQRQNSKRITSEITSVEMIVLPIRRQENSINSIQPLRMSNISEKCSAAGKRENAFIRSLCQAPFLLLSLEADCAPLYALVILNVTSLLSHRFSYRGYCSFPYLVIHRNYHFFIHRELS